MKHLSNRIVTISRSPIFFGNDSLSSIDRFIRAVHSSGIFILVDPNSRKHCLPLLTEKSSLLNCAQIIEVEEGESSKSLENAQKIWTLLMTSGATRSSLLINLGGGVISDLGGFVAAGYQRGIGYINIPTSLMGQADAAIGGKTAVNLGNIKNQVGFFYAAKAVFIFPGFLTTLPEAHLRSGFAEIIKCTLTGNAGLWRRIKKNPVSAILNLHAGSALWQELIQEAVTYKNRIVGKDYREIKLRKVLNFGHTIGHAFEGYSKNGSGFRLLHGDAVSAGMICAAFLSHHKANLPLADMESISSYIHEGFGNFYTGPASKSEIMDIMLHDKKMHQGRLMFTLISKPGFPVINVACSQLEISDAIDYYYSLSS